MTNMCCAILCPEHIEIDGENSMECQQTDGSLVDDGRVARLSAGAPMAHDRQTS